MTQYIDDNDQYPSWWDERALRENKAQWVDGAEQYLEMNGPSIDELVFDESLLMKMMPFIASHDKRWKKFDSERFNM